jgi:hypothetical protein
VRRSPSTTAFSIFSSAKVFASIASLSVRSLACHRSSSAVPEIADVLKVSNSTELNDDGGHGVKKVYEPPAPALLAERWDVSSRTCCADVKSRSGVFGQASYPLHETRLESL